METESLADGFMDEAIAANPQPFYRRGAGGRGRGGGLVRPQVVRRAPSSTP